MADEDLTAALNDIQRCVYELHQAPARMSVRALVQGVRDLRAERDAALAKAARVRRRPEGRSGLPGQVDEP